MSDEVPVLDELREVYFEGKIFMDGRSGQAGRVLSDTQC